MIQRLFEPERPTKHALVRWTARGIGHSNSRDRVVGHSNPCGSCRRSVTQMRIIALASRELTFTATPGTNWRAALRKSQCCDAPVSGRPLAYIFSSAAEAPSFVCAAWNGSVARKMIGNHRDGGCRITKFPGRMRFRFLTRFHSKSTQS